MGSGESKQEAASRDSAETIFGVASGSPDGGVAMIRVSGSQSRAVVSRLCEKELPAERLAKLRRISAPLTAVQESGAQVLGDDALVVVMNAPNSYTGEDVVELMVHGGALNVRQILGWLTDAGARPASAGEFTRRAFANGRLSLDEAEAVAALIGARTEVELDRARRLLHGELGEAVRLLRERIFAVRIEVEGNLDFPEDVDGGDVLRWLREVESVRGTMQMWLSGFERSARSREDMRVVIAGPPNAGKSSLFNALVGRRRALVSASAGTTRDFLEAEIWIGKRRVILVDTAGLREAGEDVEQSGIELGRGEIARAHLICWVEAADQSELSAAERSSWLGSVDALLIEVENKRDLGARRREWLGVSVERGDGIDGLLARISEAAERWYREEGETGWIGNARHAALAKAGLEDLDRATSLLARDEGLELIAFALTCADRELAAIVGMDDLGPVGAEVLDGIFSRFCIGK
jgi:tRNA modification GTPase